MYNKKIFNTFNYRKLVFLRVFFFLKNFLEYFISYGKENFFLKDLSPASFRTMFPFIW